MNTPAFLFHAAAVSLLLGPMAQSQAASAAGATAAVPVPVPVLRTVALSPSPSVDTTEMRAQLSPRRYTTVAAEIGARVQRVAAEGSAFRAGQSLATFDCGLQQAQVERTKVALEVAGKAQATQTRLNELNATGRQEVEQAEGEVAKQRAELAQGRVLLSKCSIAAPFSGRVVEQKVREQQYAQPGQALLEIIDDSVLEIEFLMPSRWLGQVRAGSAVQIAVDETGRSYSARVLRLGARIDPVSQSVKVVAAIEGRPKELMAGMSGRLLVQRSTP